MSVGKRQYFVTTQGETKLNGEATPMQLHASVSGHPTDAIDVAHDKARRARMPKGKGRRWFTVHEAIVCVVRLKRNKSVPHTKELFGYSNSTFEEL